MNEDYCMFGLDKSSATKQLAKKAYYNFSLLIHPDRNSCPDRKVACEEMCNLTNAYARVIKDISLNEKNRILKECNDLSKIHDEELADIDKFSKEMPSFMDIYLETHDDMKKFNNTWENRNEEVKEMDYSLIQELGYDTIKSEYRGKSLDNVSYCPDVQIDNNDNFHHFSKPNTELISIDDVMNHQYISSSCFDYQEAHGTPSFLEDRIPRDKMELYLNPPNIDDEYEKYEKRNKELLAENSSGGN